ncbi:MAG: hypothetical protein IJ853_02225 [Rickettsiales bacterium]|nr:hypothetical protein [Rickettsiales bacterium]
MKKICLFLSVLLFGCTSVTVFSDNENCISIREFKVLQTLNNGGALAHECTFLDGCSYRNQLVYLDWQPNIDYYDDMIVKVPSNKCAVRDGVYKYTNKQDTLKTVPVIKFEYKDAPKSEKDILDRLEDKHNRIYAACLYDSKASGKEDPKFCSCCAEQFMKYFIEISSQENTEYSDDTLNKIIKKECGKIPDFMKN